MSTNLLLTVRVEKAEEREKLTQRRKLVRQTQQLELLEEMLVLNHTHLNNHTHHGKSILCTNSAYWSHTEGGGGVWSRKLHPHTKRERVF